MIDSLPTGSLFSFLWNMLVSISFQFVGFLLTYLLHTTHAAKLGSRAGLGITLIQYGFAMRGRAEEWGKQEELEGWGWQSTTTQQDQADPVPTFATAAEAEDYYAKLAANGTTWPSSVPVSTEANTFFGDATTEWLSFFLMTVGTCALRLVISSCMLTIVQDGSSSSHPFSASGVLNAGNAASSPRNRPPPFPRPARPPPRQRPSSGVSASCAPASASRSAVETPPASTPARPATLTCPYTRKRRTDPCGNAASTSSRSTRTTRRRTTALRARTPKRHACSALCVPPACFDRGGWCLSPRSFLQLCMPAWTGPSGSIYLTFS